MKSLNYFKEVKITKQPGSTTDRVVLDVETVDQPTGDFNFSGGYSTTDRWLGEVKVGDRNFLGTAAALQASVSYGQYARGANVSLYVPDIFDSRAAAGAELFGRQTFASSYQSYGTDSYGANFTITTPMTEETSVQWRYSISNQSVTLAPTSSGAIVSLPIQQAAAAGPAWVSGIGSTTTFSTLDNPKSRQVGSTRNSGRTSPASVVMSVSCARPEDLRYYQSLGGDLVGMVRAQGGYITGWGGQQAPLINSFFGGPSMVRGGAEALHRSGAADR